MHTCRLLRNRVSAQQARERKKSYVSNLEHAAKGNEQTVTPLCIRLHMYLLGMLHALKPMPMSSCLAFRERRAVSKLSSMTCQHGPACMYYTSIHMTTSLLTQ